MPGVPKADKLNWLSTDGVVSLACDACQGPSNCINKREVSKTRMSEALETVLEYCSGSVRQEISACLRQGKSGNDPFQAQRIANFSTIQEAMAGPFFDARNGHFWLKFRCKSTINGPHVRQPQLVAAERVDSTMWGILCGNDNEILIIIINYLN